MNDVTPSPKAALPERLPVLSVLGIRDEGAFDWPRLRLQQHRHLAENGLLRISGHVFAGILGAFLFAPVLPVAVIGVWLALIALGLFIYTRRDSEIRERESLWITRRESISHHGGAIMLGVAWAFLLPVLWIAGGMEWLLRGWAVVAAVSMGATIVMGVVPLGAIAFFTLIAVSAAFCFLMSGETLLASSVVLFLVFAFLTVWARANGFIRFVIAKTAIEEKAETVSLLLREFEENEADWLWQIDKSRRVRSASPRFAFALGHESKDIEGEPFFGLISSGDGQKSGFPPSLHDLAERIKRRESFSNLLVQVEIGGRKRWWELSGTPILDEKGHHNGFRGVGSDVTDQRESSEKIAYLARYDTLTGLPNRLMLNEAMAEAMREARQWRRRCAFLMIDLDRFKEVNDSLGHQVGDKLLAKVSQRLEDVTRGHDICGRLGGDEFAIVVQDANEPGTVDAIARRVIDTLSAPYEVENHTLFVGASVGSAIAPRDGRTVEELMRNADLALYRAKDDGRGAHFAYEPSLHASAEERRQLEAALRQALESEEMTLNFQPVVGARSEDIASFEALVRWNSAEHGHVSPGKFIPLAEDTRLIVPIGTWVMQQACREAVNWPSDVKVNVNVSPEQLVEPNFVEVVTNALAESRLDPKRLEIEVTESIFLRDPELARDALGQVMALGCQVALDDFGTGYSSLGYLRRLQFSTIKVDRSFVQGAAQGNSESLAIVRAVVAMAKSLEMATTAEGVENEEELELVRALGCDRVQGYYFGRPMSSADVLEVFRRRAAQEQMRA